MGRRRARVDANHRHVVQQLRDYGFTVTDLSGVGGGVPDIAVGIEARVKGGRLPFTLFMEIKDGTKPPSGRKLTQAQKRFFRQWRGAAAIVHTANEASALCLSIRQGKFRALRAKRFIERLPDGVDPDGNHLPGA